VRRAGLAAVYNVPLAGALFTAEILIGSISLPVMLPDPPRWPRPGPGLAVIGMPRGDQRPCQA